MRRLLVLCGLLIAVALALLCAGRCGRPRVVCEVAGQTVPSLAVSERWVGWVENEGDTRRLVAARRRGGRRVVVRTEPSISGLAIVGDTAYITESQGGERDAGRAALLQVTLPDRASKVIAPLSEGADQLISSGGWLVWRKSRGPALPGVSFVVAAAPVTVIRAREQTGGPVHVIAVSAGEQGGARDNLSLLGVCDGRAYWLERVGAVGRERTRICSAPCTGGDTEVVLEEDGPRTAALEGDMLLWTAPSLEAGQPQSCASVKRLRIGQSYPRVVADWLGSDAVVMLSAGKAYVQERAGLWRLGETRGQQQLVRSRAIDVSSPCASDDEEFFTMQHKGRRVLARRPLTWRAGLTMLAPW